MAKKKKQKDILLVLEEASRKLKEYSKRPPVQPPKHRHYWRRDPDFCMACGAYEAYCKRCKTVGLFNRKGKLIDTAN